MNRSYSSVVNEDPSTVRCQVFKLIRDGKSSELGAYLCDRRYARNLLTLVKTNPSNNECLSLLMIAVLHGHDEVVREILSHSPNRTETVELEGRVHGVNGDRVNKVTALWCALDRAHFNVARTLIDIGNANVNHGPIHPLLIDATIRGRLDIVQFLIENNYAHIDQTKTNDGNTALAMAVMEGHFQSVCFLCMAGASTRTKNLANKTPIVLAAENNQMNIVEFLLEHEHDNASFNDLEFAIASHIISKKDTESYQSQWVIELLRYSLVQRIKLNVDKSVAQPIVVYNFEKECQSIEEFDSIKDNEDRLYIEGLLIYERVLLTEKDNKLLIWLFDEATKLANKHQFNRCLDLMVHIFHISQQFEFQNYFKEFFWLFYNMLNSKISIPVDQFWKTCDLIFKPLEEDHKQDKSYLLRVAAKMNPPEISLILNELKLTDDLITNIYFHGSWAQGTCTNKSDQDLIIVTRQCQPPLRFQTDFDYFHKFELHKLFGKYDVCVYSIENFEELLKKNYLLCVQCLFLPNEFKLKEEIDFRKIYFEKNYYDPIRIKKVAFYEMFHSFNLSHTPTRSPVENQSREDFVFKNFFHGIRFLDMAQQLIQYQTIQDFTSVSHLFSTMNQIRDKSNMNDVLQFVKTTSDELKMKLDLLVATNCIKGTFQVQILFDNSKAILEKLKIKCQKIGNNNLFIYLIDDNDQKIKQLMIHLTYHGEYPLIIQQIQNDIHTNFQDFLIKNVQIKSSISNQGIPMNDIDKQLFWKNTFQFNYKLSRNQELLSTIKTKLKANTLFNSFTYCIKRIDRQKFDYFIQMSLNNVGLENALKMSDAFLSCLKRISRNSVKIQQQFILYDNNFI